MKEMRCVVRGMVQGVGFRAATRHEARRLGLAGWVRNRDDGAVELVAVGDDEALGALERWLAHGPPGSRVTGVDVDRRDADGAGERGFEIRS